MADRHLVPPLPLALLVALPAAADPFVTDWLAACRAVEDTAPCIREAYEGLCGYAPDPGLCRDTLEARLTGEVWALQAAPGVVPPDWRPPYRCDDPPPQMTVAGCEAIVLGSLVAAWEAAAR